MSIPLGKTSPLMLAAAWIVVGIPLAWGIYQTAIKALPLFVGPAPQAQFRPVHSTESEKPAVDRTRWAGKRSGDDVESSICPPRPRRRQTG